jgi:hypothetical protein
LRATCFPFLIYQDTLPPTPDSIHRIDLRLEGMVEGRLIPNDESVEANWISPIELCRFPVAFRNDRGLARRLVSN